MMAVPVKEASIPPVATAPFTWRKRLLFLMIGAMLAVVVVHFLVVPWIVRHRVSTVLADAGFPTARFELASASLWGAHLLDVKLDGGNQINDVQITYSLNDLVGGKIDTLRLAGVRYNVRSGSDSALKGVGDSKVGPARDLPIRQLDVLDSTLVLDGAHPVEVPLQGSMERKGNSYELTITAGEGSAVSLFGTLGRTLRDGSLSANIHALSGELASRIARSLLGDNGVSVAGSMNGTVAATWQNDAAGIAGKIELSGGGGGPNEASGDKLRLTEGVFIGEARIGPATRPSGSVNVASADLSTSWLTAKGVSGKLEFPPTTQPQKLTASQVKIGQMELNDGNVDFAMKDSGDISITQTRWNWLGGELSASDFAIPRDGPLSVTVQLREVELGELLKLLAEQKASGQGKLTGELPVTVHGSKVTFGNGRITALDRGSLQIKDAAAVAPAAEAAAQSVATSPLSADQIKRDVIEALSDFQFDRLTGKLVNTPEGLSAFVRMSGRGRKGAQQALDYEWRVHGLDQVLRFYLGLRQAIDAQQKSSGKAGS
jgi:hypothetical protein